MMLSKGRAVKSEDPVAEERQEDQQRKSQAANPVGGYMIKMSDFIRFARCACANEHGGDNRNDDLQKYLGQTLQLAHR